MEEEKSAEFNLTTIQEALLKGMANLEVEKFTANGIQIVHIQKGLVRFKFIIPATASDSNGYWHVGAIATIIDMVGSVAIFSATGSRRGKVTMDYNISCYSLAKSQEEVEMEGKVIGSKGKLTSVVIEVRRKTDGELIAIGRQWTASNDFKAPWDYRIRSRI